MIQCKLLWGLALFLCELVFGRTTCDSVHNLGFGVQLATQLNQKFENVVSLTFANWVTKAAKIAGLQLNRPTHCKVCSKCATSKQCMCGVIRIDIPIGTEVQEIAFANFWLS